MNERPCVKCAQLAVGQQGKYPCESCGLPTPHDRFYDGILPLRRLEWPLLTVLTVRDLTIPLVVS